MRVYLISFLLFIIGLGVSANTCEEKVLKKFNSDFHNYLTDQFKENSNLELFKTIGFLGKSTPDGFRMVLNLSLNGLASSDTLKSFNESVENFIKSKARFGKDFGVEKDHFFFYPKDEELPCLEESLFLDSTPALCAVEEVSFKEGRIEELKSFLDGVFEHIAQMELREVTPNPFSMTKSIEVSIKEELIRNDDVELSVVGGTCDMGASLKKNFSCTIIGGERMTLKLRVGELEDELVLTVSPKTKYKLEEVKGRKHVYQVKKLALQRAEEVLAASDLSIESENCAIGEGNTIVCEPSSETFTLSIVPEGNLAEILTAVISPVDGFELRIKTDTDSQYKLISAHVFLSGEESGEELAKVSFSENENCTYISSKRKILKCKKLLSPYSVSALYTGGEKIEKSVEIGSFEKFTLKLSTDEASSLTQKDNISVLGDGLEIAPSSYKDLLLKIEVKKIAKNKVTYIEAESSILSEKEREEYKYSVELSHNSKISDVKEVNVGKYVSGDNYFFDIIKKNRQCHFKLMKVQGTDEFKSIGQEEFLKNMMEVKVQSNKSSCSSVQKTKDSIQVFCSLRRDKLQERVSVQLYSNGQQIRSVNCLLLNENYEDEEEEDDRSRNFSSSSGSSSKFADTISDSFSKAFPSYINSRYQTQQPSYYNPLMYNYGYNPYSAYTPGYYQSPGLWNTMYMFNPATY